jgi:hypothetical protein
MAKKGKKITLKKAAEQLTAIAEKHLSSLPEEEQDARVALFARRNFKKTRGANAKSSGTDCTPVYPVTARGRE